MQSAALPQTNGDPYGRIGRWVIRDGLKVAGVLTYSLCGQLIAEGTTQRYCRDDYVMVPLFELVPNQVEDLWDRHQLGKRVRQVNTITTTDTELGQAVRRALTNGGMNRGDADELNTRAKLRAITGTSHA